MALANNEKLLEQTIPISDSIVNGGSLIEDINIETLAFLKQGPLIQTNKHKNYL